MINFKEEDITYLYDDTIEGLFSCIYLCCKKKVLPKAITVVDRYESSLFDNKKEIITNYEHSKYINDKLIKISEYTHYLVYTAFLSFSNLKEMIILKYFVQSLVIGYKLNGMKNNKELIEIEKLCKKITLEVQRLKGFLRFKELPNKVLYAKFKSDNNVIEYLVEHFKKRLRNEHFIIYDQKRRIIALYNTKECHYFETSEKEIKQLEQFSEKDEYEKLWQNYFTNIAIKERTNRRCQLNFMPKRYWENMIEMEGKY